MDLYDAVVWQNLVGTRGPKAGYVDGSVSMWPVEAWQAFQADTLVHITVLADAVYEAFDVEDGNAAPEQVANANILRLTRGEWSVNYCDQEYTARMTTALAAKGQRWSPAGDWPAPGIYLWAANWDITPGTVPAWCPVAPVAVQDRHPGPYDVSTCFGRFPGAVKPPPPPPPPPTATPPAPKGICAVNLPQLAKGAGMSGPPNPAVEAVQQLLKLRGGYPSLAVDGRFGDRTDAAQRDFQRRRFPGQTEAWYAVVGTHCWGALLGAPQ